MYTTTYQIGVGITFELLPHEEIELFFRVFKKVDKTNQLYDLHPVDEYVLQDNF